MVTGMGSTFESLQESPVCPQIPQPLVPYVGCDASRGVLQRQGLEVSHPPRL